MGRELETASRSECIHGSPPTAAAAALANHSHLRWHRLPLLPTQCLSPPHSSLGRRRHKSCPNTIRALGRRCRAMPHREYRRCQPRPSSDVTNSRSGPSFLPPLFVTLPKLALSQFRTRSGGPLCLSTERAWKRTGPRPPDNWFPPPFASLDNRRVARPSVRQSHAKGACTNDVCSRGEGGGSLKYDQI